MHTERCIKCGGKGGFMSPTGWRTCACKRPNIGSRVIQAWGNLPLDWTYSMRREHVVKRFGQKALQYLPDETPNPEGLF